MSLRNGLLMTLLLILLAGISPAYPWTNHAVITYTALHGAPGMTTDVTVESVDTFLSREKSAIGTALDEEEEWARANVRAYSPRPDPLRFSPSGEGPLVERFLRALRLNPNMRFALFSQPRDAKEKRRRADWESVSLYPRNYLKRPLAILNPGDRVSPLEVIATASDEPDYGYDFGLYEDNGTPFGKEYGYGTQPISDPKILSYTQAGFHMGFYHESWIVFKAAPYLEKTCPEQRTHLYYTLARLAFRTGHPYWGYRFAGMGLHYVQDLTQPFHASPLPGVSTPRLLWISALNAIGFRDAYNRVVAKATSDHMLLEDQVYDLMRASFDGTSPGEGVGASLLALLADGSADDKAGPFDGHYIEQRVSREACDRAGSVIEALGCIPADRKHFGKDSGKRYIDAMAPIMRSLGSHSRAYLRGIGGH